MALGHKLSGLKRTNWDNKTDKQKVNILKKHYETLGYKLPKYLQSENISNTKFNSALNRVLSGYDTKITNNKIKNVNDKNINNLLKSTVNKFNKTVDSGINKLTNLGYTEKQINYLKGNHTFLTLRSKSFFTDNKLLDKIDIENLHINSTKLKKEMIKFLNNNIKTIKSKDFINKLTDSKKSDKFYKELLELSAFNNLNSIEKNGLLEMFNELNSVQKDIVIKTHLNEFREKYENVDELSSEHLANIYNKWSNILQGARREI